MGGQTSKNNANMLLGKPAIISPRLKHTSTIIFLHGLGDTGDGWACAFKHLNLPNVRVVCPTAPIQSVTLNGGIRMNSWYDIYGLHAAAQEDEEGIKNAAKLVNDVITEEEKNGIPSKNIILGGFSQGGALALYTAYTCNKPLAGVIGLSTYLPLRTKFPACIKSNKETPLFQGHGTSDPVIPYMWGQMTHTLISEFNPSCIFKSYEGVMHSSCDEEMNDVKKFLAKHIPKEAQDSS